LPHQKTKTMKTAMILLVTVLTLQFNMLFAGTDGTSISTANSEKAVITLALAPVTPAEATFEDVTAPADFSFLAPGTPSVATFDDILQNKDMPTLAPVTPAEADFSDTL
jgi:hypothetical protein